MGGLAITVISLCCVPSGAAQRQGTRPRGRWALPGTCGLSDQRGVQPQRPSRSGPWLASCRSSNAAPTWLDVAWNWTRKRCGESPANLVPGTPYAIPGASHFELCMVSPELSPVPMNYVWCPRNSGTLNGDPAFRGRRKDDTLARLVHPPSEPSRLRDYYLSFFCLLPSISHSRFSPPNSAAPFPLSLSPSTFSLYSTVMPSSIPANFRSAENVSVPSFSFRSLSFVSPWLASSSSRRGCPRPS